MKIRKPTTRFQESDGAAKIPSSDDANLAKLRNEINGWRDILGLGSNGRPRNCNNPKSANLAKFRNEINDWRDILGLGSNGRPRNCNNPKSANLAKFRNEINGWRDFLSLGSNGRSRNCNIPKSDEQAINLGRFVKEIESPGAFLGLGIDTRSNYEINHGRALNPTPLMSYHHHHHHHQARASSSSCCAGKKRMREQKDQISNNVKKGPKRSRVDEYPEPINPPQELVQIIGPNIRPVFVYRKQLVEWDTREDQNRLFVNDRKKLMDFLTEEDRLAVEDQKKPGIGVVGIDRMGREYKMRSNRWESLDKVVVNKGWHAILAANGAEKGDWVHLWAYRRDAQFCLYVDFRHQP